MKTNPWIVVVLPLLFFSACSSGPYVPAAAPGSPMAAGAAVVLLDEDLQRTVAVDHAPVVRRTASNLLNLQVALRNRSDTETIQIQVQTLFRNKNGQVLYSQPGSPAAWETISLTANQTTYYMQTSLTPEATAFTVQVRYLAH